MNFWSQNAVHVWKKWKCVILESKKWDSCPGECESRRLSNRLSWKRRKMSFWMEFYEFWMKIWSKYAVHVWKRWKLMMFDQKCKKWSSSRSLERLRYWIPKIRVKSEGFFTVVGEKVKNETDATFLHVYDVFASKFRHFSKIKTHFKIINLFKAKWKRFVTKVRRKWWMTPFCSIWPQIPSIEMKMVFSLPNARTLRKPMLSLLFC